MRSRSRPYRSYLGVPLTAELRNEVRRLPPNSRNRLRAHRPTPKELPDDYREIPGGIESAREHYAREFAKLSDEERPDEGRRF